MVHFDLQLNDEHYESIRDFIYFIVTNGEGHEELYTEQSIDTYIHNGIYNFIKMTHEEHTLVSETVLNVENDTLHECALQIVTQGFKYKSSGHYKCTYNNLEFILSYSFVEQALLTTPFENDERYYSILTDDENVTALYFLYSLGIQT